MKSLMVVPIYSTKTTPAYLKECLDAYTFQPTLIDFVMNDPKQPEYRNQMDCKCIESFKKNKPTEFVIFHASDLVVDSEDLEIMITQLEEHNLFAVGLYPLNDKFNHARLGEEIMCPARILVWKAPIFEECLVEFEKRMEGKTIIYDELYRIAEIANEKGYKCQIAGYARPWHFDNYDQFRNMRIK